MRVGQIRRIIVPVELGYSIANNDTSMPFDEPKPSTFSGQRSLDFVLRNQGLIDKTLLFDLEVRVADCPKFCRFVELSLYPLFLT